MIIKSFEINKIDFKKNNFYLLYGENEGFKNEVVSKNFKEKYLNNTFRYEEKEILDNTDDFYNSILSKSLFENERLIIITRVTDKIINVIKEIFEKNIEDIKFILLAGVLEKKSKLRIFFEKDKNTICIPFYSDTNQTLSAIALNFFRNKKVPIAQETINLLIERSRGSRQNLNNELEKVANYIKSKDKIKNEEILKLTNLAENYNFSELADNCLAKNKKKTINILNENNFSTEDSIAVIRTFLFKAKRLLKLQKELQKSNDMDKVISSFKPPIFWKDKEILKKQLNHWPVIKIENLISNILETELLIKKNSVSSINIISDFIITKSN